MYAKLYLILVASLTVSLTSATDNSITDVPDFQVFEGSPAKFPWKYTGSRNTGSFFDTDGTLMMTYTTGAAQEAGYDTLIDFIEGSGSMGMTILETGADDTGEYVVKLTFTSESPTEISKTTTLTVITAAQYEEFKMGSNLKINSGPTVNPASSIVDVLPGGVTLVSTVPSEYTQVTTCTLTSSGTQTACGDSCTETTCNFNVNGANDGERIDVKVMVDSLEAAQSYGYTLNVKAAEKKTALGSTIKASEVYIAALVFLVWIWG